MKSEIAHPRVHTIWAVLGPDGSEAVIFMRKRTRWVGWFHIITMSGEDAGSSASWADPTTITDERAVYSDLDRIAESGVLVQSQPVKILRLDVHSESPERLEWALQTLERFGFTRPTQIPP